MEGLGALARGLPERDPYSLPVAHDGDEAEWVGELPLLGSEEKAAGEDRPEALGHLRQRQRLDDEPRRGGLWRQAREPWRRHPHVWVG